MKNNSQQTINFGKLAVASYRLIRYHKRLWLIGLIAGTVPLGGWNCNVAMGAIPPQGYSLLDELPAIPAGRVLFLAAAAISAFVLIAWCRGAAIGSLSRLASGEPAEVLSCGRACFWRLLPLYPLTVAAGLIAIILAIGMMSISLPAVLSLLLILLSVVILAVALIGLSMLFEFTSRAAIIEELALPAATGRAWRLLTIRPRRTLTLFAHGFFLSVAGIIIVLTLCMIAFIPAFFGWVYALRSNLDAAPLAVAIGLSLPAVAVLLYLLALYNTYFIAYWNLAYAQIAGRSPAPGAAAGGSP